MSQVAEQRKIDQPTTKKEEENLLIFEYCSL